VSSIWTACTYPSADRKMPVMLESGRCTRPSPLLLHWISPRTWRIGPLGSVFRLLDKKERREQATQKLREIGTIQNISQAVETLSGRQRQAVAVARAAAFAKKPVVLDEPTSSLGAMESRQVLRLIGNCAPGGSVAVLR